MTYKEDLHEEMTRLLNEWLAARANEDRVCRPYISSGSIRPGEPIRWPDKVINAEANREMQKAIDATRLAYHAYMEARKRFREHVKQPV